MELKRNSDGTSFGKHNLTKDEANKAVRDVRAKLYTEV